MNVIALGDRSCAYCETVAGGAGAVSYGVLCFYFQSLACE